MGEGIGVARGFANLARILNNVQRRAITGRRRHRGKPPGPQGPTTINIGQCGPIDQTVDGAFFFGYTAKAGRNGALPPDPDKDVTR